MRIVTLLTKIRHLFTEESWDIADLFCAVAYRANIEGRDGFVRDVVWPTAPLYTWASYEQAVVRFHQSP